jgi:hypothetical protein
MPQYTVRDPNTGRTITFNWTGAQPPSQVDMAEIFAEAGGTTEPPLTRERQAPGTLPASMSGHAPGINPPAPKSVGGFLANAVVDLPSVPKSVWDAAQMVGRYNPLSLTGMQNTIGTVSTALKGQMPNDPMVQVGAALAKDPGAPFRAAGDKLAHPIRTAGEVLDYAYDKPVSAAMDASALMAGGAGVLGLAGRAPRVAAGLARAARATDPVNLVGQGVGGLMKTTGAGGEVAGEAMMRKALNMSDADVRARGGVERTALEQRIPATAEGEAKLTRLMAPIGQRQQAAIDAMPDFMVSHEQLPRLNALVDETSRIRGSDPARYDAAVNQRTQALTDPNMTADRPVIDGMLPTEGRYPAPVPGRLLHENKQALQRRAAEAKAYIANPNPRAEGDALAARGGDYRQLLSDASPEYAAANAEFEPLMALQEQLQQRALHRGGHDVPYAVGFGLQAARGNVISPVAGMLSGLALRNPRLASGLAQGTFDFGQTAGAAGRTTQMVAPGINRLDALQRAILRQRASDTGR